MLHGHNPEKQADEKELQQMAAFALEEVVLEFRKASGED
jgi:hypothetical protein